MWQSQCTSVISVNKFDCLVCNWDGLCFVCELRNEFCVSFKLTYCCHCCQKDKGAMFGNHQTKKRFFGDRGALDRKLRVQCWKFQKSVFETTRNFSLSWANSFKVWFNIILPSTPRYSKWTLSFSFPYQNLVCISLLLVGATCPTHHIHFTSGAGQGRGVDTRFIRSPLVFQLKT